MPSYLKAMINVLVAHRRTDLVSEYISKMNAAGVRMTAYIANFLIKGYAMVGDLEHARFIFESLVDPPEGMAAPYNHVPHEPAVMSTVDHMAPVYREVCQLFASQINAAYLLSDLSSLRRGKQWYVLNLVLEIAPKHWICWSG